MSEELNYDIEGFGYCRHCEKVIARRDKRNLIIGAIDVFRKFIPVVALVKATAFRCCFCHTRHQFMPFQESQYAAVRSTPTATGSMAPRKINS